MSKAFRQELQDVISRHAKDAKAPDFVLASYLEDCLNAFDKAVSSREYYCQNEKSTE